MKLRVCLVCPGMWCKDLEGANPAGVEMEGSLNRRQQKQCMSPRYNYVVSSWEKIIPWLSLGHCLEGSDCPGSQSRAGGEGATDGRYQAQCLNSLPGRADVPPFLTAGQAENLDAPVGIFSFSYRNKQTKNLYCEADPGIISGFQYHVYIALKFLLPPVWQDLYVSVIPKGNINSENRFPSLWKQLLSWKQRQPWMKYKWGTEWGREGELHLAVLPSAAMWPTEIRVGWEKKCIVHAKLVPRCFWAKITDWTTCFGSD